jgi:hypothetical protein
VSAAKLKRELLKLTLSALLAVAGLQSVRAADEVPDAPLDFYSRLIDLRTLNGSSANRPALPEKQADFLVRLEQARDIDVCDRAKVVEHFGAWLDERLALGELMTLSPEQQKRERELFENSLGFSTYWQGIGSKRSSGSACSIWFVFTDVSPAGAVTHRALTVETVKHLFSLCATYYPPLPHGQVPWVWKSCLADARRNQIVFSFVDMRLSGVSIGLDTSRRD